MTTGSPTKLILSFTLPLLAGNIFQQFYNMVDAIIVGRYVGVQALAAVGATGAMSFFILGFVTGLATGFSVIAAHHFGAGDEQGLKQTVAMSVLLSAAGSVIITAVSCAAVKPLLILMRTPADIIEGAELYITIIFAGIPAILFYNLLSSVLRAIGDSRTPLYFLLISSVVNIILDIIFVVPAGMGVAGAAWATVISQALSCVLCFLYILKQYPILHPRKGDWKYNPHISRKLLKLGIPTALQSSVTAIGVMILQSAVNAFGSTIVAAYTAASKVEQLATQPGFTFGLAMATYTGQNLGAGRIDRVEEGVRKSMILSMIFSIGGGILVICFGGFLTRLFVSGDQTAVIDASRQYLNTVSVFFCVLGTLFIYRNTLQGLGNAFIPLMSGAVELTMRVGVALILSRFIGYTGICLASPIAWAGAVILLVWAYYVNIRRLKKQYAVSGTENIL